MAHRQALERGAVIGGDYEIERVLGAGGFGITYLAKDKNLDTQVAIKEYFPVSLAFREEGITVQAIENENEVDYTWGLERFLAEARTLARLKHPNIVRVSRYFKENGTAYMVLGFVSGQNLESWLKKLDRPPSQEELDDLLGPLLDALEVVHADGIVHRDIKPENIYIRASDSAPVLLDFGAARQSLGQHSRATAAFVSPGFSPPESYQNDPKELGPWTDIYGLSATLYRAVAGKAPAQVLARIDEGTHAPLTDVADTNSGYRTGFLKAVDQGMSVKRHNRPKSVQDWRASLLGEDIDDTDAATIVKEPLKPDPDDKDTVVKAANADKTEAATVVRAPKNEMLEAARPWAIGILAAVMLVSGLRQIYLSFEPASPPPAERQTRVATPPQTQPATQPPPAAQPATQPTATPTPQPAAPATPTDAGEDSKFDKTTFLDDPPEQPPGGAGTPPRPIEESPQSPTAAPSIDVDYRVYRNARYGFEFEYPFNLVTPGAVSQNGAGQGFASSDGKFNIAAQGFANPNGRTANDILNALRESNAAFQEATIATLDSGAMAAIAIVNNRVRSATVLTACNNQLAYVLDLDFANTPEFDVIGRHVVETFKVGRGDETPSDCDPSAPPASQPPPSQPPSAPPAQAQPQTPPLQQQQQAPPATAFNDQPDTNAPQAFNGDQSLKRIAVYGWSSTGFQGGLWSGDSVGPNGSALTIRCSTGSGAQRDARISWEAIPTGNAPIVGQHQVLVRIGNYTDGAVLNFTSNNGQSTGEVVISETSAEAGNFLGFLQQMANGQEMVLQVPSTGYQETFPLYAAGTALGPCLGQPVALGWTNQGRRDDVISVYVRNARGGAIILRCDTSSATRGNAVMAFSAPSTVIAKAGQQGSLVASVGNFTVNIDFILNPGQGVMSGFFYHVVAQSGTKVMSDFLALLRRGNRLRLVGRQLGVDESFSLSGSSRALADCANLY